MLNTPDTLAALAVVTKDPAFWLSNWRRTGEAIKAAGLDFVHFEEWSRRTPPARIAQWDEEGPTDAIDNEVAPPTLTPERWWQHCPRGTPGDLFELADRCGSHPGWWREGGGLAEVWAACDSKAGSWWLQDKVGMPTWKLRVKREALKVRIDGRPLQNCLAVPFTLADGTLENIGLIADAPRQLEEPRPPMLPLLTDRTGGWFTLGKITPGLPVYVSDTLEDVWACWRATGAACVLVAGWRDCYQAICNLTEANPDAVLVLVPPPQWAEVAEEYSSEFGAAVAYLFAREATDFTAYDLLTRDGRGALKKGLEHAAIAAKPVAPEGPRFELLDSAALASVPPMAWRVREVLPAQGFAVLYGPPGSGKSFLALDLATSVAEGREWFGHRVDVAPVVYLALEGESGFRLRVSAWESRQGRPLPENMHVILQGFRLTHAPDVEALAAVIPRGAMVVIDTLNRAAPSADENSSKDMGTILEGAKRLQSLTGGLVLAVHHSGKDASRGMRGHSSLLAATDATIGVCRDGANFNWTPNRVKDGLEGDAHPFSLQVETFGVDEYGDAITSCFVARTIESIEEQRTRLPRGARVALAALHAAAAQQGTEPPQSITTRFGHRAPAKVVAEQVWCLACYAEGLTDADAEPESKRKAFTRARGTLRDLEMLGTFAGFVWPLEQIANPNV